MKTRQVHDIPLHRLLSLRTALSTGVSACAATGKPGLPSPIMSRSPVQYSPNLSGLVPHLNGEQHIPVNRVADVIERFHGFRMFRGTVVNMISRTARHFQGFVERIRLLVVLALVKYMDETGIRIGGNLRWLYITCKELPIAIALVFL